MRGEKSKDCNRLFSSTLRQLTMQDMKAIVRRAILAGMAAAFVVLTVVRLPADVCVYKPPKVRRICGTIVDPQGRAVPGVVVTILQRATTVATCTTADEGEFNFDVMEPGKYELDAMAPGFKHARYQLTLLRPTRSCKNALQVQMEGGSLHCEGNTIRETKKPLSRK